MTHLPTTPDVTIGPADFDPYRPLIDGCYCSTCRAIMHAATDVLDFGGRRHRAAAADLLAELHAGTHQRMTFAEHVAEARVVKAARLAAMRADGAPASEIAAVERGYVKIGAL